jgi:HSP20 family protein
MKLFGSAVEQDDFSLSTPDSTEVNTFLIGVDAFRIDKGEPSMASGIRIQESETAGRGRATQIPVEQVASPSGEMERPNGRHKEEFMPRGWLRRMRREQSDPPKAREPQLREMSEQRVPRADMIECDEEILVRAEMPGVDKKDLDISVTHDTVTIRGTTRRKKMEEQGEFFLQEIGQSTFVRTIALLSEVDGARAKATICNGMVEIVIPKLSKYTCYPVKVD